MQRQAYFQRAAFERSDYKPIYGRVDVPKNFENMKKIARMLSHNIPFVRVDLYEIGGQVYFSEMTFSPCGGLMPFSPREWDEKMGNMLRIKADT